MANRKIFDLSTDPYRINISNSDLPISTIFSQTFSDGEHHMFVDKSVEGDDVTLILSTVTADDWLRLLLVIEAIKSAGSKRITVVMPYMGYARQDKYLRSGTPESSFRGLPKLLESSGVDRIITIDVHSERIKEFFKTVELHSISAQPLLCDNIRSLYKAKFQSESLVIVAPDKGSIPLANQYLSQLSEIDVSLATIIKKRNQANKIAAMDLSGNVDGKVAIIVDDMADTCGTLIAAAALLKSSGAKVVYAAVTHPIFSGDALTKLATSDLEKIFVTDTVGTVPKHVKIEMVSVLPIVVQELSKLDS